MHVELLAAQQHGDVCRLLARHGELVLYLDLHIFRYPITPEPPTELACRLAFEQLDLAVADDFTVHVREHEGDRGMLENRVDASDTVARLLCVRRRDDRFQNRPPVDGLGCIVRIGLRQVRIPACLRKPQFQLALIRTEPNSSGCIASTNPGFPHLKPVLAWHVFRFHEPQCRAAAMTTSGFGQSHFDLHK